MAAEIAMSLLVENLATWLIQEAVLVKNVHKDFVSIKDELEIIQSFLKDADATAEIRETSNVAKTWVKQVREMAFFIEDVLDEYMCRLAQGSRQNGLFLYFLQKSIFFPCKFKVKHEIASKIQDIKVNLLDIKERGERYGFRSSDITRSITWHDPRVHALFVEEDQLVGIESSREELIGLVTEGPIQRVVITMVAMGGAGKTTLAKKVYDHQTVVSHFDCRAWITVSQSFKLEELLRRVLKQFHESSMEHTPLVIDTMEEFELIDTLRNFLQERKYVVVFDDVWKMNFWEDIEHALPDKQRGSRILITTRSEDVAPSFKQSPFYHVYKLQPLSSEKAWELFCMKAFPAEEGNCPPELLELSSGIVGRCGGLPLAIVTIGGLLSRKDRDVSEWRKLQDSLGSLFSSTPQLEQLKIILSLSYHDLPYNIKSCFLYFGIFPEDLVISCPRLIRLWMAEGFVKARQGVEPEEVAREYLTELIHRSLVQVTKVSNGGRARECRIHDLLHEFILCKSDELGFCHMPIKNFTSLSGSARHISINNTVKNVSGSINNFQTRSVSVFEKDELPMSLVSTLIANSKLLKVLDFEDATLNYIPEKLGKLRLLRYLSIKWTKVAVLPKSIGKLQNLETLDLRESLVRELPFEIDKLSKLRHLLANFVEWDVEFNIKSFRGIKIKGKIGCLVAMQKLGLVEVEPRLIVEFGKLKQLRKLEISKLKGENGIDLCTALENMVHLQSLFVSSTSDEEFLELQSMSSPPPLLRSLILVGRLRKLPNWISKLKSVAKISLFWSSLKDDPLRVLQGLSNLVMLELHDAYDGEQLHFEEGCLQKLKELRLRCLNGLNMMIIDKGAMPLLAELDIGPCPEMKEVPLGIRYLRNLNTLYFVDMLREFALSMLPGDGHDYYKVQHIPNVYFAYRTNREQYESYKLGESELLEFLHVESWSGELSALQPY